MAKVLVLGGEGFVGQAVCKVLKKHKVWCFSRSGKGKQHIAGSVSSLSDLERATKGKDVVINLVGLSPLKKPPKGLYEELHVKAVKNIIAACKKNKVKHLIHMGVLGANPRAKTSFLRTRGRGEALVEKSRLKYTVFKPSIIFDKENELLMQLQKSKFTCIFPMIPAQVQPIYRKDVAKLFALAVDGKIREKKLEIAGPERMSLFEMAEKFYRSQGFPCIGIPLSLVKLGMGIASTFSLFGLGEDQIKALTIDNIPKRNKAAKYLKLVSYTDWIERKFK